MKHKIFIFITLLILILSLSISSFAGTKTEINDYMQFKYELTTNPNQWAYPHTYYAWVIYSNAKPLFISSTTPININLVNGKPYIDNTSGSLSTFSYNLSGDYFGSTGFGEMFNLRLIDYPAGSIYNSTVRPDTGANISYIVTSHDITGNSGLSIYPLSYLDDEIYLMQHPLATEITQTVEQFCLITSPRDDYRTVSKTVSYSIIYRIKATSSEDIILHIKNNLAVPLAEDTNIQSYLIKSHTGMQYGDYYEGTLILNVNYKTLFTGTTGIVVSAESVSENRFVSDMKNIQISAFVDSNADGFDDYTLENAYKGPVAPGSGYLDDIDRTAYSDDVFGEVQYLGDKLMSYVTMPFKFIGESFEFILEWLATSSSWITGMSNVLSTIFGFLPPEITGGMIFLFLVFVVFAIIKMIRG